jgi:hypothetical protein
MKQLFIILLLLPVMTGAQSTYTEKESRQDLLCLIGFIEKNHPDLDIHSAEFTESSKKILESVSGKQDAFALFGLASQIAARAKENHYGLGNWEDEVHAGILDNSFSYFPFYIRVLDDRFYVFRNLSDKREIAPGNEIVTINGRTAKEICKELYRYIPSDADIKSFRDRTLDLSFNWMYYIYIERPDTFELEVRTGNGIQSFSVEAETSAQMTENFRANPNGPEQITQTGKDRVYSFEIKEDYAVLTLRSFSRSLVEENNIKAKNLYKEIFNELSDKNIPNLIIDLRWNTGGRNEFADEMVPYINANSSSGLLRTSLSWEGKVRKYNLPKPDKNVFHGEIYVLINGRTYSSASMIARNLREYADAIIIGEESGTRYSGFVAGSKNQVTLPNSGFQIYVPRYAYRFPDSAKQPQENKGVLPDHPVRESIDQILRREDPVMEKALSFINEH